MVTRDQLQLTLFHSTEEASKVIKSLTDAIKGNQVTVKVEGGDQEVPKTPATPSQLSQASLVSEVVEGDSDGVKVEDNGCGSMPAVANQEATKSQSPHKLPRQDKSIRESEASEELADHVPPMHAEVTTPHDEGPPGRRGNMSRQGKSRITGGQNKTLVATPSETDSAVSMVTNKKLCVYLYVCLCVYMCVCVVCVLSFSSHLMMTLVLMLVMFKAPPL